MKKQIHINSTNYRLSITRAIIKVCLQIQYTLHLNLSCSHGDHWGATDLSALSRYLILFSDSITASRNINPVHSDMLFSQCNASFVGLFFSLLALSLVKLFWQALPILIHTQATLTCVSLPCLRCHHRARRFA